MDASTAIANTNGSRRLAALVVITGLVLGAAAFWGTNKQVIGLFHDDGIYTVVAKSLYQGGGYRIVSLPTSPPQTKYPFFYSYLLSWIWAVDPAFPQNIAILKTLNIAILVAIFVTSVVYYKRHFPDSDIGGVVFGMVVCTNPILFTYTDFVVSDLLYVLLVLGAIAICHPGASPSSNARNLILLAMICGLACLTRLAAAPLVIAGSVQAFLIRRWSGVAYVIGGVLVFIAPWLLWVSLWPHYAPDSLFGYYSAYDVSGAKIGDLGISVGRHWVVVLGNARYLIDAFDVLYLLPLLPGLGLLMAVLTGIGMIDSVRREEAFAWCFFLFSVVLLLIWPFHPGRYMAPLVPLLVLFLFRGMTAVEHWVQSVRREFALKGLLAKLAWSSAVLIVLLNGVWLSSYLLINDDTTTRGLYGRRMPFDWRGFEESFAWVRENTQPDSLLATAYDPMYYLYTGRQAIRPALHRPATYFYPYGQPNPDVGSVDAIKLQLEKMSVKFLIIDPLDGYAEGKATLKLLDTLVSSYGGRARKVFTSADGKHRIYALGPN
jgi:diacylglycerol kinase